MAVDGVVADKSKIRSVADSLAMVPETIPDMIPSFNSATGIEVYLAIAMKRNMVLPFHL